MEFRPTSSHSFNVYTLFPGGYISNLGFTVVLSIAYISTMSINLFNVDYVSLNPKSKYVLSTDALIIITASPSSNNIF